ncbi:translation initiation factor eIF-2B epsilon subunit, GEF [Malassezia psittaci]|uniref:Translation initiation factor eIF2B subunit epsilon n=1 Tax=Malassezia psittaci TaxID=1821823 RepID=A0AAF0FH64_9BASI|nr:translation initiation factor eIF-2B epsilon subunit, GEF [Malassezia psittaci]
MAHEEIQEEDPLQAVVLCDVFTQRFSPLTLDMPRCLMPVCNVPLLEWTMETLARAGVQEVFLLATWHIGQIRAYLEKHYPALTKPASSKTSGSSNIASSIQKLTLIAVPEARSVGDMMRELDAHQVIKSDFLLMHADAVGNLDISAVVAAHRQRRRVDRNAIMTICTMPVATDSRAKPVGDQSVFTIAPSTSQLLYYNLVPAFPRKRCLKLPLDLFEAEYAQALSGKGAEVDVRNDLVHCGVDICAIDVPPLFTENFDYQGLLREFVQGILTSDLLEAKIFLHIAPPANATSTSSGVPWDSTAPGSLGLPAYGAGYMLRASGMAAYEVISNDILSGWTYPYTPRLRLPSSFNYSHLSSLRFLGEGATYALTARIGFRSLIGSASRLKDEVDVHHCTIGSRVTIGARTKIDHAFLWDGVQVGENCVLTGCILGHNVTILDNVRMERGTIIASNCVVGPDVHLSKGSRVSLYPYRESEDEDQFIEDAADETSDTSPSSNAEALGAGGKGYLWEPQLAGVVDESDEEDDDDLDEIENPRNAKLFDMDSNLAQVELSDTYSELSSIDADSEPDALLDDSEDEIDSETDLDSSQSTSGYGSVSLTLPNGAESQTYGEKLESENRLHEFRGEASASLERAFEENHAAENAAIELKTLRMASNVPPSEVRRVAIAFVLARCDVEQAKQTSDLLDQWGPLLRDVSNDDQVEALAVMQSYSALNLSHTRLFLPLLKKVYNDEIVSDEAILAWWRHPSSRKLAYEVDEKRAAAAKPIITELRKRAEPVVRHILETQESSEEESETESEKDTE